MSDLNKTILSGRLTRDVELHHLQSGTAVASIGLAVNRKWRDAGGELQEEVTFVECSAWQRTAELAAEYLHKGSRVQVVGRLKLDEWETGGEKRSKLKVVVEELHFLDRRPQDADSANGAAASEQAMAAQTTCQDEVPY